jgi:hypothetical protein
MTTQTIIAPPPQTGPSWPFGKHYLFLSSDTVSGVNWYRVRPYLTETCDWVLAQDSNYWYKEDGYVRDFWICERLYTLFAIRWS